jgi:hypothetical protein
LNPKGFMMGFVKNNITNGVKVGWHRALFRSSTKPSHAGAG